MDVSKLPHARQPEVSSCGICVDEAVLVINILLNAALNYEITGCGDLCSYLTNPYAIDACEVVCNGIGIYEFIQQLENSDIDPIYYCELIKLCTAQDCTGKFCQLVLIAQVIASTLPRTKLSLLRPKLEPLSTSTFKSTSRSRGLALECFVGSCTFLVKNHCKTTNCSMAVLGLSDVKFLS